MRPNPLLLLPSLRARSAWRGGGRGWGVLRQTHWQTDSRRDPPPPTPPHRFAEGGEKSAPVTAKPTTVDGRRSSRGRFRKIVQGRLVAVGNWALKAAGLVRRRVLLQRNGQPADQAFGSPVELRPATELRFDARDHAAGAESPRHRFGDRRAVALFPHQLEHIGLRLPLDVEAAGERR